jgi:hypothetical protein
MSRLAVVAAIWCVAGAVTIGPLAPSIRAQAPAQAVRHVVVFKYKPDATPAQIQQVTDAFRALATSVPGITAFEDGVNDSPEGKNLGFTHVYTVTFKDAAARDAYLPHPEHRKFGQLLGKSGIFVDAFVVDYTPRETKTAASIVKPSGLAYSIVTPGSGDVAAPGRYVTIHETTTFEDGRVHFTTDGRDPIRFLLGGKQVIDGLDEGVTGMKVGERRRMVVPPALSQRRAYPAGLSPQDVLHYDVVLVKVE